MTKILRSPWFVMPFGLALGGAMACLEATAQVQTPSSQSMACPPGGDAAPPPSPVSAAPPPAPTAYVIGRSDQIHIRMEPDMSMDPAQKCTNDYTVGADGAIIFCMLGTVKIEGMTAREIESKLETEFKTHGLYQNPNVTVDVKDYRSQSVYVNGQVRQPGEVPLKGNEMTLMHAITAAGGYTPEAGPDVFVLRPPQSPTNPGTTRAVSQDDPTAQRFTYRKGDIMAPPSFFDPPLLAGDNVFVATAQMFYINGEVRSSSHYVWEPCMTISRAIAMAGGTTAKASLGRSEIQRIDAKGKVQHVGGLKLETPVYPRDTIIIKTSLF